MRGPLPALFLLFLILFPIHHSNTQTQQWRLAAGTEGLRVTALDIYRSNPDTMYAISDSGLLISTNRGDLWNTVPGGQSISSSILNAVRVDPFDSRRLYASHDFGHGESNAFSMSTDGGATWDLVTPGGGFGSGAVVETDPLNHHLIYAGVGYGSGILRSTDRGQNWEFHTSPVNNTPLSMAIDPGNPAHIWISYASQFFRTLDGGATWTQVDLGYPVWSDTRVLLHPTTEAIFVTCWPNSSNPGGVFRSTDGGQTWDQMNNGLEPENRYIFWIAVDPSRAHEMYLCSGTPTSTPQPLVFFSPDTGNTWLPFADGIPYRGHAEQIVVDTLTRRVFAAVATSPQDSLGIYILDLKTHIQEAIGTVPTEFKLQQNYPNPFNSSTIIELNIPTDQYAKLEVFDILGRRVAIVAEGNFTAGTHRVSWDATNHPSGMYVCRYQSTHRAESIIMTLIR